VPSYWTHDKRRGTNNKVCTEVWKGSVEVLESVLVDKERLTQVMTLTKLGRQWEQAVKWSASCEIHLGKMGRPDIRKAGGEPGLGEGFKGSERNN